MLTISHHNHVIENQFGKFSKIKEKYYNKMCKNYIVDINMKYYDFE